VVRGFNAVLVDPAGLDAALSAETVAVAGDLTAFRGLLTSVVGLDELGEEFGMGRGFAKAVEEDADGLFAVAAAQGLAQGAGGGQFVGAQQQFLVARAGLFRVDGGKRRACRRSCGPAAARRCRFPLFSMSRAAPRTASAA
jgi:hypothetical protein